MSADGIPMLRPVDCPVCGAPVGHPCTTDDGGAGTHVARLILMREARP